MKSMQVEGRTCAMKALVLFSETGMEKTKKGKSRVAGKARAVVRDPSQLCNCAGLWLVGDDWNSELRNVGK